MVESCGRNQAIQRAHRFGRERPLHVIRFITLDTIEERISNIVVKKQELFENYIETALNVDTQDSIRNYWNKYLKLPICHKLL